MVFQIKAKQLQFHKMWSRTTLAKLVSYGRLIMVRLNFCNKIICRLCL